MLKLIAAYKNYDLFSKWEYVTREVNDTYALEYLISKHRWHHQEPEYFKKLVYGKPNDNKRQSIQELGDLEFDALIFVDEKTEKVWLRYHDETIYLSEFRTTEEIKNDELKALKAKYCRVDSKFYIENRQELDEFLAALETFDQSGDFDDIEVMQFINGDVKTTTKFPILLIYYSDSHYDSDYQVDITKHRFTLVDDSLGR